MFDAMGCPETGASVVAIRALVKGEGDARKVNSGIGGTGLSEDMQDVRRSDRKLSGACSTQMMHEHHDP